MRFNENAQLDSSQVEDRRGSGGIPGGGLAVGGGGLGIIIMIVAMLFGVNPFDTGDGSFDAAPNRAPAPQSQPAPRAGTGNASLAQNCQVGADANAQEDCRIVGFVNSIQRYWSTELPRHNIRYEAARTVLYSDGVQTGCGGASSAVGPFYCPRDQKVYLDLSFFDELQARFGARGGPFAQAYVLAHEYGHHIQNLTGVLDETGGDRAGPQSHSVRVELQADCYAGAWARNATDTGYISSLTDKDIAEALSAAEAVGDDRIQKRTQGQVNPESWTHGSAQQRQYWFTAGYKTGDPTQCDTFSGRI
ncbi:MAG: neutral zinc metallopeptidase [Chloroflexi bacterium]|nr:neutral zinc metallopeptidase [Chloroflexota bacterium]